MNSDSTPSGPAPGTTPSAPNRTSNLKSRWKRGPSPGAPAATQRPAASASCGVVTDITSVRETISGQHAKGYVEPERTVTPPVAREPAPIAAPAPRVEAPRPAPAQPRPKEFSAPPPREPAPLPPRREAPAARPQQDGRGSQREQYVALKPDPTDAAPRRLRTENSKPVPVEEYAPSAFARAPDKVVPAKSSRDEGRNDRRRESGRSSSTAAAPVKPNASIPLQPVRAKETEKPKTKAAAKSGGLVGFFKRIFGGGEPVVKQNVTTPGRENFDDIERDDHRHSRDGERSREGDRNRGRGGDDRRQHHRHRSSSHHQPRDGRDSRRDGQEGRRDSQDSRRGGDDRRGRSDRS